MKTRTLIPFLMAVLTLAACGGGGSDSSTSLPTRLSAYTVYENKCEKPRTGSDMFGNPYPDRQGTLADEKNFLRSWIDANYLWYREVPADLNPANYRTAIDWFDVLKTPLYTASGKPKDQFHFTYPTAQWDALTSSGVSLGYGVTWASINSAPPRTWYVAMVEPGSPAALQGVRRGDRLVRVDGVDFVNAGDQNSVDIINAGLFPETEGRYTTFGFSRSGAEYNVTVQAAEVAEDPVQNVKVFDTASGKVGYITFNAHNAVAEREMIEAFDQLRQANVSDLVLDMRYNGGGLLYLAAQVGYMIAGPDQSSGKAFERILVNDKLPPEDPVPFVSTAIGFNAPNPAVKGTALPWLGLRRVTILTSGDTCSASESVINGLRGIDVEVNLVGSRTCGKPYGFYPTPNCGTTYFAIELQGANNKGFGDYADGFPATCTAADDLQHDMGDPAEGMLAAALRLRETGSCSSPMGIMTMRASSEPLQLVRNPVEKLKIMSPRM